MNRFLLSFLLLNFSACWGQNYTSIDSLEIFNKRVCIYQSGQTTNFKLRQRKTQIVLDDVKVNVSALLTADSVLFNYFVDNIDDPRKSGGFSMRHFVVFNVFFLNDKLVNICFHERTGDISYDNEIESLILPLVNHYNLQGPPMGKGSQIYRVVIDFDQVLYQKTINTIKK